MSNTPDQAIKTSTNRRRFLQTSAAAAATAAIAAPHLYADGNDLLRVGLVGCGGRGTGAARDALRADRNVKLVAMGDAFQDRLTSSLNQIRNTADVAAKVDVAPERQFTGFNAYQQVINSGVDVVLLTTPPHFRPMQIEAAVRAGKHVFAEKPVAVDAHGVRRVLAACQEARRRRLSVVSGLCWRYDLAMRETLGRIRNGDCGEILTMQCNYLTGTLWHHGRNRNWSDMEYQVRNWLYFTWLSGDFNTEQHVHSLDKMAWALGDQYPTHCYGMGGRIHRTEERFGHIYDHMSVVYEYASGVKVYSMCRQMAGCHNEVRDYVYGTMGKANLMDFQITGPRPHRYSRRQLRANPSMYQVEHNELFRAIRRNEPINNGNYMAKSTMMAIMGRQACYTGQRISWQDAFNSTERLGPQRYVLGDAPEHSIARPGPQAQE